jgi:hypothetical protein
LRPLIFSGLTGEMVKLITVFSAGSRPACMHPGPQVALPGPGIPA